MIEVCFCEKAHFYFTPPPSQSIFAIFWGGGFGDGGGNWYICGDFFYSKSAIRNDGRFGFIGKCNFFDDEKDFDWAAFGGGLCEFGLG